MLSTERPARARAAVDAPRPIHIPDVREDPESLLRPAGQILVGQRLFAAVEERVDTAPAGDLELKGVARPVAAYEVRGLR